MPLLEIAGRSNQSIFFLPPRSSLLLTPILTVTITMMPGSTQFATVLPHEPLPSHPRGYVHLQGAFVPKRKEGNQKGKSSSSPAAVVDDDDVDGPPAPCKSADEEYIRTTLFSNLVSLVELCGMESSDVLSVNPVVTKGDDVVNKVRIEIKTPSAARTLTSRLQTAQG